MPQKIDTPTLHKNMDPANLRNYYWLKKELVDFCRTLGIPGHGKKFDIIARLEIFLQEGVIKPIKDTNPTKQARSRDSIHPLTAQTPVVIFYNDAATRSFFIATIGKHFHFSVHLINFIKAKQAAGIGLTYQDLVDEWNAEYERKKDKSHKPTIQQSCEYNQFMRDFFSDKHNDGKSLKDAIQAWNMVKKKKSVERKYQP